MTSAQEARADGWQRDAGRYLAALTAATRENRQLREQLAAKGHAMTAEPAPDTDAFADARDRIWQNQAVREAVAAERERIRQLAVRYRADWLRPCDENDCDSAHRSLHTHHRSPFADLIEETAP